MTLRDSLAQTIQLWAESASETSEWPSDCQWPPELPGHMADAALAVMDASNDSRIHCAHETDGCPQKPK